MKMVDAKMMVFGYLIKHDYSIAVCVEPETVWKLKGRGWAI